MLQKLHWKEKSMKMLKSAFAKESYFTDKQKWLILMRQAEIRQRWNIPTKTANIKSVQIPKWVLLCC